MKCPKCGYNSFEGKDFCKKCSFNFTGHNARFGLSPIVFLRGLKTSMVEDLPSQVQIAPTKQIAEQPDKLFTFAAPEIAEVSVKENAVVEVSLGLNAEQAVSLQNEQTFSSFTDDGHSFADSSEDIFADVSLSETLSDLLQTTDLPSAFQENQSPESSETHNLSNFNWDDIPEVSQVKKPVDDFDSLFGTNKKTD